MGRYLAMSTMVLPLGDLAATSSRTWNKTTWPMTSVVVSSPALRGRTHGGYVRDHQRLRGAMRTSGGQVCDRISVGMMPHQHGLAKTLEKHIDFKPIDWVHA